MMKKSREASHSPTITPLASSAGRKYFGAIDNEVLDFSQFDDYITADSEINNVYFPDTLGLQSESHTDHARHNLAEPIPSQSPSLASYSESHKLPESPPDSVSEPPNSPPEQKLQSKVSLDLLRNPLANSSTVPAPNHVDYKEAQSIHKFPGDMNLVQHASIMTPMFTPQKSLSPIGITLNGLSATSPDYMVYTPLHACSKRRKISKASNSILLNQETVIKQKPSFSNVSMSLESQIDSLSPSSPEYKFSRLPSHDGDLSYQENLVTSGSGNGVCLDTSFQSIRFQLFQQSTWHTLWDHNLKELPTPIYTVDADKGFNFSNADDAFVCQKKNHFQITCFAQLQGDPQFVKTSEGMRKITSFYLHFYGVKVESLTQTIKVEQSQSDRSKKSFHPMLVEFSEDNSAKITVGRLHFSETTSNNMRKKGKPNPDQRYFYLVVGLHAHCTDSNSYPIVSHASEKIIVRASNPGQFESDVELCWQRGSSPESIFYLGKVGISTERPDEALVVHGNVKLTGNIVQPSDIRAKQNIVKCNTAEQLRTIERLSLVHFEYTAAFASHFGLSRRRDTGLVAQELQRVLPEAVSSSGAVQLPDGSRYENFLVVNKERIFVESVGAVKELCKLTRQLEKRIEELESVQKEPSVIEAESCNEHLNKLYAEENHLTSKECGTEFTKKVQCSNKANSNVYTNRFYQLLVCLLVLIISFCVLAMSTLYFLKFQDPNGSFEVAFLRATFRTAPLQKYEHKSDSPHKYEND